MQNLRGDWNHSNIKMANEQCKQVKALWSSFKPRRVDYRITKPSIHTYNRNITNVNVLLYSPSV